MKKIYILRQFIGVITAVTVFALSFGRNLSITAANNSSVAPEAGYRLIAEDSGLFLYLNSETTNFYLEDKENGKRTYAFPENIAEDDTANAAYKIEMQSLLVFTIWDKESNLEDIRNTNSASVKQGSFSIKNQENGFSIDFKLKSSFVSATLSVVLENGKLICSIPAESVKEERPERYQILGIAVLPFIMSAPGGSPGEIILPDGCGEIMDFSVERSNAANYNKKIYGRDLTQNLTIESKTGYDIRSPYLGLNTSEIGILSVPKQGAALGYVVANPAGNKSSYANAYFYFEYRASDIAIIGNTSSTISQSTRIINFCDITSDIVIEYIFICDKPSIYKLAKLYGEYLSPGSEAYTVQSKITAVFDIYGAVNEKKSFLGFPYTTTTLLSKGDDILEFANDSNYQNIAINLKNATKQQQNGTVNTDLKPIKKVLSTSQLRKITSSDTALFINANPLTFTTGTFKYNKFFCEAKTIYGAAAAFRNYKESTHLIDRSASKNFLLRISKIPEVMDKIIASAKKLNITGVSSDTLAQISYYDYGVAGTLETGHSIFEKACADAAKSTQLMLSNPNDYAIKYCSVLLDIPVSSSNDDCCSGSYPFLQMALGNSVPYTVEAINLYRSPEIMYLRALATGSMLHYSLCLSEYEALIDSELNYLYSTNYTSFKETVKEQYNNWRKLNDKTAGSALIDYKEDPDGITAVYENGTVVTVNLSEKTYTIS